jgi:Na+/H+ antiporter NhaD/arsenite permease-like protein
MLISKQCLYILVSSNNVLLHCFYVIINWSLFFIQKQVQKKYREIKQQRKEDEKNRKEVLIVVAIVVLFILLNAFFKAF